MGIDWVSNFEHNRDNEVYYDEFKRNITGRGRGKPYTGSVPDSLRYAAYDLLKVSFYNLKFSEKQLIDLVNLMSLSKLHSKRHGQKIIVVTRDLSHLPPMKLWRVDPCSKMAEVIKTCRMNLLRKERIEIPHKENDDGCYRHEYYDNDEKHVVPSHVRSYQYHFYEAWFVKIKYIFIRRYVNGEFMGDFIDVNYLKQYDWTDDVYFAGTLRDFCQTDEKYNFPIGIQKINVAFVSEDDMYDSSTSIYIKKRLNKGTTIYDEFGKRIYEGVDKDGEL